MSFVLPYGQHRFTEINVDDEPGPGGAYHHYTIGKAGEALLSPYSVIPFQNGPVKEAGQNGVFIEDLLSICRHRLQCFQAGEFACRENALALTKIEEALHWLNHRTADRQARNVEGTTQK
ncbi:MAG: ABC transporter ATPase [Candidatus Adiutrix sp.]|jgi:hypothetical protein|nr:ABC transporter ATPase [Candidatus Adiutrix sp.]